LVMAQHERFQNILICLLFIRARYGLNNESGVTQK